MDVVMGDACTVDMGWCIGGHGWGGRLAWIRWMAQLLKSVGAHEGGSGVVQTQDDAR